jgi:hypothetical protein
MPATVTAAPGGRSSAGRNFAEAERGVRVPQSPRRGEVVSIERSVHKTNVWPKDLAAELDEDREDAWRILKAFLRVLRDELTVDEAAQLAARRLL